MTGSILDSFLALLELALVGRILLSLLPAGQVGSHRLRDLPTTWAVSHMLGVTVAVALAGWVWRLSWHLGLHVPRAAWLLAWAVILLARVLTLPGGIVPGRAIPQERSSPWTRAVWLVIVILVAGFVRNPPSADFRFVLDLNGGSIDRVGLDWATVMAACVIINHGLSAARRAPLQRALAVLACVGLPIACGAAALLADSSTTALLLTAGAAFLIVWLRRADRRALELAVIGLAACGSVLLSMSALAVLVLSTPRPSRRQALAWSVGVFAAVQFPDVLELLFGNRKSQVDISGARTNALAILQVLGSLPWIAFAITAATCGALALAGFAGGERRPPIRPGLPDPPAQEIRALGWLLASSALIVFVQLCFRRPIVTEFEIGPEIARFAALIALFAGLVLLRAERVHAGSAA